MSQCPYGSISLITESREENRRSEETENVKADAKRKIRTNRMNERLILCPSMGFAKLWDLGKDKT